MKKYEYKTIIFETKGMFGGKIDADSFNQELNGFGRDGWNLVEAIASNQDLGSTARIICIFKRELAE